MTTAEHVKIVNDVSLSQRPTLPAARDKARLLSKSLSRLAYCILHPVVSNQYQFLGLVTKLSALTAQTQIPPAAPQVCGPVALRGEAALKPSKVADCPL